MPNRQNAIVLHGSDSQLPTLVPSKLRGLSVWYVQVIFPDGRREQVGAFCDKAEANDWIGRRSGVWLVDYERRRIDAPWLGVRYRSSAMSRKFSSVRFVPAISRAWTISVATKPERYDVS
jgi:hypothetical protein